MNRIYVDHTLNAISGDFYTLDNNQPINNSTFLALYDQESVAVYVVNTISNTCIVGNFTGITQNQSSHCLTTDTVSMQCSIWECYMPNYSYTKVDVVMAKMILYSIEQYVNGCFVKQDTVREELDVCIFFYLLFVSDHEDP